MSSTTVINVAISSLVARKDLATFDGESIAKLAAHIECHGLQPLTVRALGDGRYEVIDGHLRLAALKLLECVMVPCIVIICEDEPATSSKEPATPRKEPATPSDDPTPPSNEPARQIEEPPASSGASRIIWPLLGGVAAVAGATVALPLMGFGAGGIAAGSLAAKMMSAAAIANGGGVAAGSAVAVLQSAGAAGLGATATGGLFTAGAGIGEGTRRLLNFFKPVNN